MRRLSFIYPPTWCGRSAHHKSYPRRRRSLMRFGRHSVARARMRAVAPLLVCALLIGCARKPPPAAHAGVSENITWTRARKLLCEDDVHTVVQTHRRKVYIEMSDGRRYVTQEPKLDMVIAVLEGCGRGKSVHIATE